MNACDFYSYAGYHSIDLGLALIYVFSPPQGVKKQYFFQNERQFGLASLTVPMYFTYSFSTEFGYHEQQNKVTYAPA